ncbi:hypothetical protein FRB99_001933 [Tulasnella sp. 403]|nr:hypothetical protein FRB99_001933 [Tulasnella sp. 403]
MFIINVVIMARTYAIYNCRPKVLYTLIISYLACFVPTWAYYYSTAHNLLTKKDSRTMETIKQVGNAMGAVGGETSAEAWILRTCYSTGVPKQLGAVLASGLIFESGLFLAMMWQLYRKGTTPRMMRRFYFDGKRNGILLLDVRAAIVGCLASGEARAIVASRFHLGFKSMLCSHMILHLRAYFMTPISFPSDLDDSKSYPQLATGTAIHFASPDAVSHSSSEGEGYGDGVAEMGVLSLGRTRSQGVVTFADIALDRRATREQDWTNSPAPYLRGTSVVVALPLQDRSGPRC